MRSTEREFVELLPATALSGWPFRAIQRWLAPTADIKQVSIGKPQAGGGDQAVRSMWMWCFSEQWWGNKYGKSEHGKATNIVNKVTRSKQPNFEDLESWQLSLAIHSPTVLSGFLTAQITNQHQVFFPLYPGGSDCPYNIVQASAGKRRADPAFSKRSSVSTSICILGMEWDHGMCNDFALRAPKIKYIIVYQSVALPEP